MREALTSLHPGQKSKRLAWYASRKSGRIQLTLRKSARQYARATLSSLLNKCLRQALILSAQTHLSGLSLTDAKREKKRLLQRMRTARSLTNVYCLWRQICTAYSSPIASPFGFWVSVGTSGLSVSFVKQDLELTRFLLSGTGRLETAI